MARLLGDRIFLLLGFTLLFSLFLYRNSFSGSFFQDDWFTLRIAQPRTFLDFFAFFIPRTDVIYYRPLGMQVLFFVLQSLFGLQSWPFHAAAWVLHAANSILMYFIIQKLTGKKAVGVLAAFFYATSTINFIPMHWASTVAFPMGFFFIQAAFLSYLFFAGEGKRTFALLFGAFTVLSFFTNELWVMLPGMVVLHMVFIAGFKSKLFLFLLGVAAAYGLLRVFFLPSFSGTYAIEIGKSTAKALVVYMLWLFHWPEEIRNQIDLLIRGNTAYVSLFPALTAVLILLTAVMAAVIGYGLAIVFSKKQKNRPLLVFFALVAVSGISLPLLFPAHTYAYYLSVTALGVYGFCAWVLVSLSQKMKRTGRTMLVTVVFLWGLASWLSIANSESLHWTVYHARLSGIVTKDVLARFPAVSERQRVYINNDEYLRLVLADQEAFRILYKDSGVQTEYYGKVNTIWKNIPEEPEQIQTRLQLLYVR